MNEFSTILVSDVLNELRDGVRTTYGIAKQLGVDYHLAHAAMQTLARRRVVVEVDDPIDGRQWMAVQ